jgi:hypothetical protein
MNNIPIATLSESDNHERLLLEEKIRRLSRTIAKAIYERDVCQAQCLIFMDSLKRKYNLGDQSVTIVDNKICIPEEPL